MKSIGQRRVFGLSPEPSMSRQKVRRKMMNVYNCSCRTKMKLNIYRGSAVTRRKSTCVLFLVPIFIMLFFATQTASAFYNPNTGRWLSRDPLGDLGFKLVFAGKSKMVEDKNDYLFIRNDPLRLHDNFGLSVADIANMYSAFVDELKALCACHLSCPELGWRQNVGAYWGCTRQTENLEEVFDKLKYEDMWDITVSYDTSRFPLNHNSVDIKPRNPDDPLVNADTWKGCFTVTWPKGSSQKDFKRCFTCKELLNK